MATRKPRIVIIGAGLAGLTAANHLFKSTQFFDLCVVEAGSRIGGRINTTQLAGDRIELGATWIHGIQSSPIHKIAQEINALNSDQPWERMDGFSGDTVAVAEGGFEVDTTLVQSVSTLVNSLLDFVREKDVDLEKDYSGLVSGSENLSVGSFLRNGLDGFLGSVKNDNEESTRYNSANWSKKMLVEAIFRKYEYMLRSYYSADDLKTVDYNSEKEYITFPGEDISIAKGYISIIESLASVLPTGMIQLGRKVEKIEWQNSSCVGEIRPVKLHFSDGSVLEADHVIVTVSLGVLKAGIHDDLGMFSPRLPDVKVEAISKLGYGVTNKLFLQLSETNDKESDGVAKFPFLDLVFHDSDSDMKDPGIPWWMRKTPSIWPIYKNSSVLLLWFAGKEAVALESLSDEEIIDKVSATISSFLCNGKELKFAKVLKSRWASDPLFLGSYSYVAVGSSGDDIDKLAEPLPEKGSSPPLQILFAGEATHRSHYSTTHGAYLSGLREANRLLRHYKEAGELGVY